MSTQTLTITEFLEARLNREQEAWERGPDTLPFPDFPRLARVALTDIAAKRAILAECQRVYQVKDREYGDGSHDLADEVLRLLAEPYRNHPDWRADW